MRYLMTHTLDERDPDAYRPSPELMAGMGRLIDEMTKAGVLLATEGCLPTSLGAKVSARDGKVRVTDGPFAEAKEVIAGFVLVEVRSKDEAIQWASRFADVIGDVDLEIRWIAEHSDVAQSA